MNDRLQTALAQILDQLQGAASQYGPQAVQTLLAATRFDGLQNILYGIGFLAIAALCLYQARRLHRIKSGWSQEQEFGVIACWVFGVLATIGSLATLGNVWNWVAVFNPVLALAHYLIAKVTQ